MKAVKKKKDFTRGNVRAVSYTHLDVYKRQAGHNVRVTGYDLKKGIYTTFEADVSAPGSVVINAKLFGDIVRKLPDGIVSVCSDENNAVNIACGNADYNISGTASDDFPDLPSLDYCSNLSLPQDTICLLYTSRCV